YRGSFREEGARLMFAPLLDRTGGPVEIPDPLVPVHWGGRRYLVPEARMKNFCDEIADGIEPRVNDWPNDGLYSHFLLHDCDAECKATRLPELSPSWRAYLRRVWRAHRRQRLETSRARREWRHLVARRG